MCIWQRLGLAREIEIDAAKRRSRGMLDRTTLAVAGGRILQPSMRDKCLGQLELGDEQFQSLSSRSGKSP